MNIVLKRIRRTGFAIDGEIYIDNTKLCDTAENLSGSLRAGTYTIVRHKCKQYARFIPLIDAEGLHDRLDNPDLLEFTALDAKCMKCKKKPYVSANSPLPCHCLQIKAGNGIHNRKDGSIIVGKYLVPGCLTDCREPFENICERLRKLVEREAEVTLTIQDCYPDPKKLNLPDLGRFALGQMDGER